MISEDNKAIVRRFIEEIWNQRKVELAPEIIDEDFEAHVLNYGYSSPKGFPHRGPEHVKPLVDHWYRTLPDYHEQILHIFGEGDKVVVSEFVEGTHTGEYVTASGKRVPPTGKKIKLAGIRIYRIENNKIAEFWALWDLEGFRKQIGVPTPSD